MKRFFLSAFLLALVINVPFLVANGRGESVSRQGDSSGTAEVTVTDFMGREVTVKTPVERIVFTHYSSAEALRVLDAWDLVVGRDGHTNDRVVYPNLDGLPALTEPLGAPYTPNMEELVSLEPDLLVLEVIPMPGIEELIAELEGIVPVVTVKTYDPEEMFHSFSILGAILGREKEAEAFTAWVRDVQSLLLGVTEDLDEADKPVLFFKTGYGSVEELGTFTDELDYIPARNRMAGCVNLAAKLPSQGGWLPSVDSEWLAGQDPDVLIIGDPQPGAYGVLAEDAAALDAYRDRVAELPAFSESSAVRNGRVYMLGDSFFGTPRHIIGFAYLAKWCHPESFGNMNPAEIHQEYFDRFLRVEADVINEGIFVYPSE
jgi:iron complex transport system substrate-binding protein